MNERLPTRVLEGTSKLVVGGVWRFFCVAMLADCWWKKLKMFRKRFIQEICIEGINI